MPIYEYRCRQCRAVTACFLRAIGSPAAPPVCQQCGGDDLQRLMSAFATGRSTAAVHEAHPAGSPSREYYRDPRNIGRNVEAAFDRHGVAMPDSVRQSIDAARSGETTQGIDL